MPLVETLPVGAGTAQWQAWGTVARIVVTDPAALDDARELVEAELAAVDAACSRFRPGSELSVACRAGGRPVTVSPLLADLVAAALEAARQTAGDVDPTVGAALCGLGYDRDFAAITGRQVAPAVRIFTAPDWRAVRLHDLSLTVPDGVLLDLGATAKAAAADRAAARVALRMGVGVLVALGGDIATAGPAPEGGWRVLVQDRPGDPRCTVHLPAGAALATSSTAGRTWGRPGELLHHILDPRTGQPAESVWRTVSVAAFSCLRANTLSTAAIVRGQAAPNLLHGVPARLVTGDLDVLRLGGWPA
ncbi:FAD:protein FMN transferase [Actinoplanes friuliensis]|uniref:FAD:protein FMN transferase n=1 Tax=Actinoplanes friuliensis DSM 7358 TaxID=1246995 RepID=U5WAI3_9ACTN|nr:FAD:protein FMN transferase [Actinoplanes friuliensis]AGZ44956.1 ApbE-like thiamine biosynthesis lipoprotein [Actinoplanes friuliensis DSM 7358]